MFECDPRRAIQSTHRNDTCSDRCSFLSSARQHENEQVMGRADALVHKTSAVSRALVPHCSYIPSQFHIMDGREFWVTGEALLQARGVLGSVHLRPELRAVSRHVGGGPFLGEVIALILVHFHNHGSRHHVSRRYGISGVLRGVIPGAKRQGFHDSEQDPVGEAR